MVDSEKPKRVGNTIKILYQMKKSALFFLVVFLSVCLNAFSQRKADIVVPYEQNIQQILINPFNGHVIVKEKDVISDYNPETQKMEWKISKDEIVKIGALEAAQKVLDALESVPDLAKSFQSTDEIYFIPNSPFVRAVIENRDIIINSMDGKVVFNSGTVNYRILSNQFVPEMESFLLLASDGKVFSSVLWDLKTGKEGWKTELGTVAGMMSMLKDIFSLKNTASEDKSIVAKDVIYTSVNGILYKLDKASGKIDWQSKDKINTFYLSQSGNDLIVIKNAGGLLSSKQALNVWSTTDGIPVWKDDIKTNYIIYLEDWSDRLLVAHSSGFNFYFYADGKKVWKKDAKGSNIKQVIPIDDDYLYVADKEMNLIDKDGQNKWKKFVEICDDDQDPVFFLDKIGDNQVVYLTATYGNIVDYVSGKKIWKKNIDFEKDRPVLYALDDATNTFLVYNDKKVYKFDASTPARPEPIAKLKKVKNEESISGLELFDWGISLVGEGDVIGVSADGSIKYHNTYNEVGGGKRKFLKGLGHTAAYGLSAVGVVSGTKAIGGSMFQEMNVRTAEGKLEKSSEIRKNAAIASASFEGAALIGSQLDKVNARFSAMKQNADYAFILAKGEKGESAQLVKVRKNDGEEVDKITIDNDKPVYDIDPVTDDVYYVYKNELRVFSKK